MEPLSTPDTTIVQQLAAAGLVLLGAVLTLVNAFGWAEISAEQAAAITGVYVAFSGLMVIADAIIRNGRARAFTNAPKGAVTTDSSIDGKTATTVRSGEGPGA